MMAVSTANGTMSSAEKGQPYMAPRANHTMPRTIDLRDGASMKEAIPSIVVHIVKDDGRNALDAWNSPGLVTTTRTNSIDTRTPTVLRSTLKRRSSHTAHTKPNTSRKM